MTSISAVVEGFAEVAQAEQAVAPRLVSADRTVSSKRSGRAREVAIFVSIGLAEAVWCTMLGYAAWALFF